MPVVRSATCLRACSDLDVATAGATVRVSGANLAEASRVVFLGGRGRADDVTARTVRRAAARVEVKVPARARTGKLVVTTVDGQRSKASPRALRIAPPDGEAAPKLAAASGQVDARVNAGRVFYFGKRRATLDFLLKGSARQDVRVDLVRVSDARSVAHWFLWDVEPGVQRSVAWNGRASGRVPRGGRYAFRIAVGDFPRPAERGGSGVQSSSASDPPPPSSAVDGGSFAFLPYVFPIRGRHSYGGSGGRFGAGRSGHTHQGQDVFARCGTPLVAARGGRVRWKKYHSAAGNYLVVDGDRTGVDTAYMHLAAPSPLDTGDRVYTGQLIGYVGDTGDAVGCHLHFEMWSAPGWYEGGAPFDPLGYLKAWDRVS